MKYYFSKFFLLILCFSLSLNATTTVEEFTNTDGWRSAGATISVVDGKLRVEGTQSGHGAILDVPMEAGNTYTLTYNMENIDGDGAQAVLFGPSWVGATAGNKGENGETTISFTPTTTGTGYLVFYSGAGTTEFLTLPN